jgi:non-specific serine/threonine protein kinase
MDMELSGSANCLGPGVQVGEYRLQGVVGEGGFGIVYRARDLSLDRIVAVKEYMPSTLAGRMSSNQIHVRAQHKGAFDAGLRSFINEARLLAKFSHPALVHVYRFFEENGTAYMVMRYYEGQTFRAFLAEQQSSMNERWLSAMLCPILDVLEMLHAADCFHRDIAPDNVFLQESGMPVLLDFGAARRIIGDMTQALTMVLKPGFAPIEQYADDGAMPQGAWTDVYQLGAMIYLAITGKVPPTAVARMISDPIQMLTQEAYPGYSSQFLQGVHRALSVRPQDRPQSIAELKGLLGIRTHTAPAFSPWAMSGAAPLEDLAGGGASGNAGFSATVPGVLPMDMASPPAAPASGFAISPSQRIERVQDDLMSLVTQGSAAAGAAPPAFEADDSPTAAVRDQAAVDAGREAAPLFAAAPVVTIPLGAPAVVGGLVGRATGQLPPGKEAWAETTQDASLSPAAQRSTRAGGSAGTGAPAWLWAAVAVAVLVLGAAVWWVIPGRNEGAGAQVAAPS